MIRVLTFISALLLALPALAHPSSEVDLVPVCQSFGEAVECGEMASGLALGSDEIPLGEKSGSKVSVHCQMHFAVFAVSTVSASMNEVQEHDASFKVLLLFNIGYVVPRPPDAHA